MLLLEVHCQKSPKTTTSNLKASIMDKILLRVSFSRHFLEWKIVLFHNEINSINFLMVWFDKTLIGNYFFNNFLYFLILFQDFEKWKRIVHFSLQATNLKNVLVITFTIECTLDTWKSFKSSSKKLKDLTIQT